jgi:hypothetical protein
VAAGALPRHYDLVFGRDKTQERLLIRIFTAARRECPRVWHLSRGKCTSFEQVLLRAAEGLEIGEKCRPSEGEGRTEQKDRILGKIKHFQEGSNSRFLSAGVDNVASIAAISSKNDDPADFFISKILAYDGVEKTPVLVLLAEIPQAPIVSTLSLRKTGAIQSECTNAVTKLIGSEIPDVVGNTEVIETRFLRIVMGSLLLYSN